MNSKYVNKYSLISLSVIVVALVLFLGNTYLVKDDIGTAGGGSVDSVVADTITKKTGPHGAYDPHATLTPEKHIQVALQHKQEGRITEAIRTLSMAIMQYANNKDLYAVRGSIFLEQGQPADALSDIQQALSIAPDDTALLTNRAQIYRQFGQIKEALSDLNKAIELNPDLVAARFNRGAIYYSSEDFENALVDFDQCIAIDPHAAGPYFNRASTRYALGDIAGAREDMDRFIQLSKNEQWKSTARDLLQRWGSVDNKIEAPPS